MTNPSAPLPTTFDPAHGNFGALDTVPRSPTMAQIEDVLTRFAADNALLYRPRSPGPDYPGCVFATRTVFPFTYHHFSTTSGRYIDFGNLRPDSQADGVQDAGRQDPEVGAQLDISLSSEPPSWGYLALQIDRHLPNLMLISKRRVGSGAQLPVSPDASQALSLEGDFDRYFTLYCPRDFEQDALYVFTPDLMALLIDEATPFDVEIVDKWMFFYVPKPFNSLDPAVYRRLFSILTTIGSKIVSQTGRYDDAALDVAPAPVRYGFHWDPSIVPDKSLPSGERLKVKSAIPSIVIGLVVAAGLFTLFELFASGQL